MCPSGKSPEEGLWQAVILRAFLDLHPDEETRKTLTRSHVLSDARKLMETENSPRKLARQIALRRAYGRRHRLRLLELERDRAHRWFKNNSEDFKFVCQAAGISSHVVREKALAVYFP